METTRQAGGKIQSHRDLIVWQKATDLAVGAYALARLFPPDERFRMVDQLTRAAVSVPANIAEGHARGSRKDFAQFLSMARGSLMETETFLELAIRLGFLKPAEVRPILDLVVEVSKMLTTLRSRLLTERPKAQTTT